MDTERICQLNDLFRSIGGDSGRILMSSGIEALGPIHAWMIYRKVQDFDNFNEDNDPHGEHDFGSLTYHGKKIVWKMDYYDKEMMYGSKDPANPDVTTRVLTIMLAEEY